MSDNEETGLINVLSHALAWARAGNEESHVIVSHTIDRLEGLQAKVWATELLIKAAKNLENPEMTADEVMEGLFDSWMEQ